MKLTEVVPWGRTMGEYQQMFGLTDADLSQRILGVGDGPASFNVEMTVAGHSVVSVDPIYCFSADAIEQRVRNTYQTVVEQTRANADRYNWTTFQDADDLGRKRMSTMNQFLGDYETGRAQKRYVAASLPTLPFADRLFDLALCSHLLFLYSEHFSKPFHLESVQEMLRVASEVRIFPLLTLAGQPSPDVANVLADCRANGVCADVIDVTYHFQKGANQMLRLTHA